MVTHVSLPILSLEATPVAELQSLGDRFRCEPFNAVIAAGVCLARQRGSSGAAPGAFKPGRGNRSAAIDAGTKGRMFERCKNCVLGRSVAARVEVMQPSAAPAA